MAKIRETELYAPIKRRLERLGFEVKAEVGAADVVALRGEELVIVELKTAFNLTLLRQAVSRQTLTESVYVAVPKGKGAAARKAFRGNVSLCRRLGLGVMTVRLSDGRVEIHADPGPYRPRPAKAKRVQLLREFARRKGDPNQGGSRGKIMTAYRQDALRCLEYLRTAGASRGADVKKATGVEHATRIMRDNHYGWFDRISTGTYGVSSEAPPSSRPED